MRETSIGTSNLIKHCAQCPGLKDAWLIQAPGSIPPNVDPKQAAAEMKAQRLALSGAVIDKNLPFSVFEGERMEKALKDIAPRFNWPGRHGIAQDAKELYYLYKADLLEELQSIQGKISTATDCWTSPNKKFSFMAINGFYFDTHGNFHKRLLAFMVRMGSFF